MLEDLNLSYILVNHEEDLSGDKIQSTDTAIVLWLGKIIPE